MLPSLRTLARIAAILLPASAFAETLESASARAAGAFLSPGPAFRAAPREGSVEGGPAAVGFEIPGRQAVRDAVASQASERLAEALRERSRLAASEGSRAPAAVAGPAIAAEVELATLLNRHWKTGLSYSMGGVAAYVTGAFNRNQDAYAGLFADGWSEPRFFNIKSLLDKPGSVRVGNAAYNVSLSPNLFKPIKSEIVFENAANEDETHRASVKRLLDALAAAGETVALTGQTYKLFYTTELRDGASGPVLDPNAKTLVFLLIEGENFHVFLVPSELVPSDKIAVFKMHDSKRVGLMSEGGRLKVYENP